MRVKFKRLPVVKISGIQRLMQVANGLAAIGEIEIKDIRLGKLADGAQFHIEGGEPV